MATESMVLSEVSQAEDRNAKGLSSTWNHTHRNNHARR